MSELARLKERIDVLDVLSRAGAKVPDAFSASEEVKFFCPFCDDLHSSRPAGTANTLKNLWHCWTCGRGGSVIDAALERLRLEDTDATPSDAVQWLLAEFPDEEVLIDPWAEAQ
jgi:DNA primase